MTSMGVSNAEIEQIQIKITRNAKANVDRKRAPVRVLEKRTKTLAFFRQLSSLTWLIFSLYVCSPSLPKKVARFLDIFLQFLAPQRSLKFFALRVFENFLTKFQL